MRRRQAPLLAVGVGASGLFPLPPNSQAVGVDATVLFAPPRDLPAVGVCASGPFGVPPDSAAVGMDVSVLSAPPQVPPAVGVVTTVLSAPPPVPPAFGVGASGPFGIPPDSEAVGVDASVLSAPPPVCPAVSVDASVLSAPSPVPPATGVLKDIAHMGVACAMSAWWEPREAEPRQFGCRERGLGRAGNVAEINVNSQVAKVGVQGVGFRFRFWVKHCRGTYSPCTD